MIIENKDGEKIKITKPASKNDTPKVVAAQFIVNDRNKEINGLLDGLLKEEKKEGKTITTILESTERKTLKEILSTDLTSGISIPAKNNKAISNNKEHTKE